MQVLGKTENLFLYFPLFCLLLESHASYANQQLKYSKHQRRKVETVKEHFKQKHQYYSNLCSNSRKTNEKSEHLSRQPRAARRWRTGGSKSGNALYFTGKEILKLKTGRRNSQIDIPGHQFTVELWVKPEGGQYDPVTIIELLDVCNLHPFQSIWTLGIKSYRSSDIPNPSYFISLKTEQTPEPSVISSHFPYTHGKWTHIAVTYDLTYLKLYINNAMVALSKEQRGGLFGIVTRRCKELRLGGDVISGASFRGTVEDLRLWNKALNHTEIYNIYNTQSNPETDVVFYESFENIKRWRKLTRHIPELVASDIIDGNENILVQTPVCGKTICDDPVLVRSYLSNTQLKTNKVIRYRVINLMDDDGTNPAVTRKQIRTQHRALVNAFSPYNISWELRQENVRNTELRQKSVLLICDPSNVGDTICQRECQHWQTGNDGGDCEPFIRCLSGNLGNGRCDFECNKEYHLWDDGDCCEPGTNANLTCFDPTSPYRGYLGVNELKEAIGLDSSTYLNIFVLPNTVDDLSALANLPWDKSIFGTRGGIVIRSKEFGSPQHSRDLVHEIGHVFGLYHVHHGVTEVECDDPCFESEASMTLGDLCSDTEPTPNNTLCRDPDEARSHCGVSTFRNTPFNNYMSYADDGCLNNFTPQQVARMHCYLDLVYQAWSTSKNPAPVPLAPKAVIVDTSTVKLQWLPPLGPTYMAMSSICSLCDDFFSVSQFATSSNSSHPGGRSYYYKPSEAEGPPDAEACKMSIKTWIPDADDDDCEQTGCYLELGFQYPVVPSRLTIWVNTLGVIEDIELMFVDGTSQYLGQFPTSCDKPLTIKLAVTERVSHVRIYSTHPAIGVDAVELSTDDGYADCLRCRSRKYKITRDPPFSTGPMKQTSEPMLLDSDVMEGLSYNYSIMVSIGQRESENSPVLHYTHGDPICGDGVINGEPLEDCDDGNVFDGDGCSRDCTYEEHFRCRGEPSLCYIHDGDGICEEFEARSSIKDCGFYTPDGFDDQWALTAAANPAFQDTACPTANILGVPDPGKICKTFVDPTIFWYPCRHSFQPGNFWIEVYFARAVITTEVIIHLGSVGEVLLGIEDPPFLRVELISIYNVSKVLQPERVLINCKRNPVHVKVQHDLSKPFSLTHGVRIRFTSYQISIAGVCLRSSHWLDPVTVASCSSDEVYNPRSGLCVQQNCSLQFCGIVSIPHSYSNCSGYREGDVCRITCETGFELSDIQDKLVCIDGSWNSPTTLECVPVDCGTPTIPNASIACLNGTLFGNSCLFKCIRPSVLQGSDIMITCQADGYWSTSSSFCQVKCRSPYSITNAKLATKACKRGYHPVGKRCKYKCHRGYHVSNAKPTKKRLKIICGKDGNWRGGICTRVRCPDIDLVFTGLYACTNIQFAGSTCTLRCREEQEVQRITCSALGKWSGTFRMCPSIGTSGNCLRLQDTDHLLFRCNGNNIGSQCTVSCLLPNSNPIMQSRTNTVRGQLVGQMDMDIPVRQLMCTALLEWQPNPDTLSCVKTCNQKYVSDGWCDADNNNERCKWDGGDCCASTSNTGLVHPFPETCVDECRCLDPMAEENIRKQVRKETTRRRKQRRRHRLKPVVSSTTSVSITDSPGEINHQN